MTNILVVNPGSTSVKFKFFEDDKVLFDGQFDNLNNQEYVYSLNGTTEKITAREYENALTMIYNLVVDYEPEAVGFRVVHGGEEFTEPTLINNEVVNKIKELSILAPLHNPPAVKVIEEATLIFQNIPQYAVFDTEFHSRIPEYASLYALPYSFYRDHKIKRYGFHGISHEYLSKLIINQLGNPKESKLITIHLGGGSSITAVKNGRSVDTSMGFTPLEGLVMATRAGDVDFGVQDYLERELKIKEKELNRIYNHESGLLGLSEETSDMKKLVELYRKGNGKAIRAISVYVYRLKKYIGAYAAALGGVDALVFSGGIGIGSDLIREMACEGLEYLGINIDGRKNKGEIGELKEVSSGKVRVFVTPTDEELMIAKKVELFV